MSSSIDKVIGVAGDVAGKAVAKTSKLMTQGKRKVNCCVLENKRSDLERQLGALVYVQRKHSVANEDKIQSIINQIDEVSAEIKQLQKLTKKENVKVYSCGECGAEVNKDAMFCSCCGKKLSQ